MRRPVTGARLTAADVACWVLKSTRSPADLDPGWAAGAARSLTRCVRRTYRLDLVTAGRPCLLWVSGRERPGVHALGTVDGPAEPDASRDDAGRAVLPVRLVRLAQPVPRSELLGDPRMRAAEVLRMPAGSNPSWLSTDEFAAVLDRVPDRVPALGLGPSSP